MTMPPNHVTMVFPRGCEPWQLARTVQAEVRVLAAGSARLGRVERWARGVSLRRYVGPITAIVISIAEDCVECRVEMTVPHRDTGERVTVTSSGQWSLDQVERPTDEDLHAYLNYLLRNVLRDTALHELDECTHVGERRPFDPHPGRGPLGGDDMDPTWWPR